MERIYDASPLIALGKIDLLWLLNQLADETIVPHAVATEIRAGDAQDPARLWVESGVVQFTSVPPLSTVAGWGLEKGETAVLSYAMRHPGAEAAVDDLAARTCARTLGIQTRGTLGLLVLAKRRGLVLKVEPCVSALLRTGYHLGDQLISAVLESVGESRG